MREHPEFSGKLLTEGIWDFEIVEELAPMEGEVVVRPSCFSGTNLDDQLRSWE
jgi:ureidoacrylate peracid hydrolase